MFQNIISAVETALFILIYIMWPVNYCKNSRYQIGFANNYFNGNIKCLFEEMQNYDGIKIFFVTNIKSEVKRLEKKGVESYYCRDISRIPLFKRTDVWITDHGPIFIPEYLIYKIFHHRRSRWIDLWHGIGVEEGSGLGRANMLRDYDLGFVSSNFYKSYYASKVDGIDDKLVVTGFPRTDLFFKMSYDKAEVCAQLNISNNRRTILYAPSWNNPAVEERDNKPLFCYGDDVIMINELDTFCSENNCNFIIRVHPDWERSNQNYISKLRSLISQKKNVYYIPFNQFPVTEPILSISDVLITDYSSISNDFILLGRPIIFCDTGIPSDKFVIPLSCRGGVVVKNYDELFTTLERCLSRTEAYDIELIKKRQEFINIAYKYTESGASQRCAHKILELIK